MKWTPASGGGTERNYCEAHDLSRDFHIDPKVKKLLEQRAEMGAGNRLVDYGMAEALALGGLG